MKKLIAFVVLLAGAGAGWWYYVKYGTPPEEATVNELVVSRGNIVEFVSATGALEPTRRYDVGSQVSGTVLRIHADYNDIVRKGQLLAEIDPSLLQVQVDIQNANVERQKQDIANQEVQLEDQMKQFERIKALYEKGLQNLQQYEAAELAIKTRRAQIESAKKGLLSVEQQLAQAKLNVGYTRIISPDDAVVMERRVDVGQTVQASMTTPSFFVLTTPLENLRLTAGVDEAEIGKIRPGMPVTFQVDAYGQKQFHGTVEAVRLNATNQNNVITYPVWISVPNPTLELRPAMTASIKVILSTANDVVRIPNQAIRWRPNTETYKALGLEAPSAGGRRLGGEGSPETQNNNGAPGGNRGNQNAQAGQGDGRGQGANASNRQPGQGQPGQNAQARGTGGNDGGGGRQGQGGGQAGQGGQSNRQPGGRGFNSSMSTMTPEQQKAFMERFARNQGSGGNRSTGPGSGRGGQGGGQSGRGGSNAQSGGRGGSGVPTRSAAQSTRPAEVDATKIDQLWAPIVRSETGGSVWKWDKEKKTLTEVKLRLGVTDGQFTELISGEVNVGDKVVSSVTLPVSMRPTTAPGQNPLLGNQPGQRQPGMQMPNPGGGGGGGGAPRGGGGGGGGRGGN